MENITLTYNAKTLMWCIHYLNELRDHGLVDGGIELSEQGKRQINVLLAQGFHPRTEDWHAALQYLMNQHNINKIAQADKTVAPNPEPK